MSPDVTAPVDNAVFAGLNDDQREAVMAARGPVCILAGAGTGKTTTITRRIAWQVASSAFEPNQILAVTFSVKAAREMGARLGVLGVPRVRAMTFHGEALAQFRRFSLEQPDILPHKGQILHHLAQRLPKPYRFTAVRDLANEIEWAKNRRIPARDYLAKLGEHEPPIPADLMARVYIDYEKRKRTAGLIDFEDLLERTVTTLANDERALGLVRARYAAFTVDEYQDVNVLQQALLDAWVGARDDICVVGDDYQSIYGFTGASPKYLLRFPDKYQHATVVTLRSNYRSTPEVLAIANRLAPALGGSRKELRAVADAGPQPTVRDFERGSDEVSWIVRECARLHAVGVAWEEMAVLYRINGRSEDFEEGFAAARIPYQVRDGSFLNRIAFKAFAARARRAPDTAPVAESVASLVVALGHDPAGKYADGAGEEATRQADLSRLLAMANEFPGGTMAEFIADLRARHASEDEGRGVQLMTFHRAKGLEFDAVFMPRVEEKELPFALARSKEDLEEERRLFYVGITRARRWLAMSYARSREGERRAKPKPSPFLLEVRPRPVSSKPAPAVRATTSDLVAALSASPLFEALKSWRKRIAAERGIPAYVVFHDATLAEIARARPTAPAELRAISGVGPMKVQRYGDEVLSLIAEAS